MYDVKCGNIEKIKILQTIQFGILKGGRGGGKGQVPEKCQGSNISYNNEK